MIIRRRSIPFMCILLYVSLLVSAEEADVFDCRAIVVGGMKYDLSKLSGEQTVSRTRDTPPTSMIDVVRLNLCADLKSLDGVPEKDQCPSGTRACLTKTNRKLDELDRIVAVIPIIQSPTTFPEYSALSSPRSLSVLLHGTNHPDPITSIPIPQSLNITLFCAPEGTASGPKFVSYNGSQLQIQWNIEAGCGFKAGEEDTVGNGGDGEPGNEDKEPERRVGSGIGWFFLVLLLAFAAYLGLGAYYNYSTYGASGADLIPHRDFWKEVPYMLQDVVSHLCSTVRPRRTSNHGGYMSV